MTSANVFLGWLVVSLCCLCLSVSHSLCAPFCILQGISRPKLSAEQAAEVKEAFDLFDTKKTGKIDYHELKVCM